MTGKHRLYLIFQGVKVKKKNKNSGGGFVAEKHLNFMARGS
jgi:hypothetical protein